MENRTKYYKEDIDTMIIMCSTDCFKTVLDASLMGCMGGDGPGQSPICSEDCSATMNFLATCNEEFPGAYDGHGNPMKLSDIAMAPIMMCSTAPSPSPTCVK